MAQETAGHSDGLDEARGILIRTERARQKLTQQQVAELVGLSRSQVANIERGQRSLTEENLRRFAQVLGINEARLRNPLAGLWRRAS
jgi:transcriptional regulator with XRE-family HTH domain